ncbi:MAG: CHAT domain-containing protein [Thermoanaerobaculia bacterium]
MSRRICQRWGAGLLCCLLAGCATRESPVTTTFPNPLAGSADKSDFLSLADLRAVMSFSLSYLSSDLLLRQQLLFLPVPEDGELHRTLRKHGYITLNELLPYREDLFAGAERLAKEQRAAKGGDVPLSDVPIALPPAEFTFWDNLQAVRFASTPFGRLVLTQSGGEAKAELAEIEEDLANVRRAEATWGPLPSERAQIVLRRALARATRGGSRAGEADWREAFSEFAKNPEGAAMLWQAHLLRALVFLLHGEDQNAIVELKETVSEIEAARLEVRAPETRKNIFAGKLIPYELLIDCLARRGSFQEAESFVDLAKARALQDVASLAAGTPAAAEDSARRRALAAQILGEWSERARRELEEEAGRNAALFERASESWLKYQELRRELTARSYSAPDVPGPGSGPATHPLRAPSASWIALDYFLAADRLHIWVVGRDGLVAYRSRTVHYEDVLDAVQRLRTRIIDLGDYEEAAATLYDLLISPVEPYIDGKSLLIVPHQALHFVPFEALLHQGEFLLAKHDIAYTPALGFARSRAHDDRLSTFLGVADSGGSLENAVTEVKVARQLFDGGALLLGEEATRQALLEEAARCDVIHFATHVELSQSYPLLTRILFGGSDYLYLFEAPDLVPAGKLVVLSGCNTSVGAVDAGDEIAALGRAFLESGARAVVVSLWEAEDQSTAQFMDWFYTDLKLSGKSAPSALAAAKRRMIQEGYSVDASGRVIPLSHPYYWSGFVLQGDLR